MKRVFSLILAVSMLLLVGCQGNKNPASSTPSDTSTTVTSSTSASIVTTVTETQTEETTETAASSEETTYNTSDEYTETTGSKATTTSPPKSEPVNTTLKRGLNFSGAISEDIVDANYWMLNKEYYIKVKQAGFDHIRLPVNFAEHADAAPNFMIDKEFLRRVDVAVNAALDAGLVIVLDFHGWSAMNSNADGNKQEFYKIWQQVAERYQNYPAGLFFELVNEPNPVDGPSRMTNAKLNEIQLETIRIIRKTNPVRKIVAAVNEWNMVTNIFNTQLPSDDKNIIVSIHNYDRMSFTHQGATWAGHSKDRVSFTDDMKQVISKNLERAQYYQQRTGRTVWISEWGTYLGTADPAEVEKYLEFFSDKCEDLGLSWCYWEFCSGFGAYDLNKEAWKNFVIKHLID